MLKIEGQTLYEISLTHTLNSQALIEEPLFLKALSESNVYTGT